MSASQDAMAQSSKPVADNATHRKFREACRRGDLAAMEAIYRDFALDREKVDVLEEEEYEGRLEKFLSATKEEREKLRPSMNDSTHAVAVACRHHHYPAVRWVMEHIALPIDNLQYCASCLCENCWSGNEADLAFLTWFCNRIGTAGADYRYFGEGELTTNCDRQSLRFVQWLVERLGSTMDASTRKAAIAKFVEAGKPEVASWMKKQFETMPVLI